jgi:sugar lactone lactonase YvrE
MLGAPITRPIPLRRSMLLLLVAALAAVAIQSQSPLLPRPSHTLDRLPRPRSALVLGVPPREISPAAILDTNADLVFGQVDFASNGTSAPPTSASLDAPAGVAFGALGEVFVADSANNRVLIWESIELYTDGSPADIVLGQADFESNDAPSPPTAASLNNPTALMIDRYGEDLFVADTGNNRVLAFTPPFETGMEATIVIGQPDLTSGAAADPPSSTSLRAPAGVAINLDNSMLVVADTQNNRVLGFEYPLETGMEATYLLGQPDFGSRAVPAMPSAGSLDRPVGVDVDFTNDALFVADSGNNRVLVYDREPLDGIADIVLGQPSFASKAALSSPTAASLNTPLGLNVDTANRVFVADSGNNRVLAFAEPFGGAAVAVFGQPNFASKAALNPPTGASLSGPRAVATAGQEGVFIADSGNNRALEYDLPLPYALPRISALAPALIRAGSGDTEVLIEGVGFTYDSVALVGGVERATTYYNDAYLSVTLTAAELAQAGTIAITARAPAPGGGVSEPLNLAIYVPMAGDTRADRVLGQVDLASNFVDFVLTTADTFFYPSSAAIDRRNGRLFVADESNGRVLSWPSAGAFADGEAADMVLGKPDFTSYGPSSPDLGGDGVTASTLDFPDGPALDAGGNLYVSDPKTNRVLIYRAPLSSGMAASMVIGQPDFTSYQEPATPSATRLFEPRGLAVDAAGNLYVADSYHYRVLVFNSPLTSDAVADRVFGQNGSFTSAEPNLGGVGASSLNFPLGVALDATGNLYVADSENHRVLVFNQPLTSDAVADRVFGQNGSFTSAAQNKGGISARSFNYPIGVALDATGNLYVADTGNHRVLAFNQPLASDAMADRVFGQNGSFTSATPNLGDISADSLNSPTGVALDATGNLIIVDFDNSRVLGYDRPLTQQTKVYMPAVLR